MGKEGKSTTPEKVVEDNRGDGPLAQPFQRRLTRGPQSNAVRKAACRQAPACAALSPRAGFERGSP
jgi:hypothetical protein